MGGAVVRRVTMAFLLLSAALRGMDHSSSAPTRPSHDVAGKAAEFIGFSRSIRLTPAQQALRDRVLDRIPAACCAKFSARTCCCPCNLARTVWGLPNFLIVRQGADDAALDRGVRQWLALVNPAGFSGKACDQAGGCARKFSRDGCGGMSEGDLSAAK